MTLQATIAADLVPTAAEKAMNEANALGAENAYLGTPLLADIDILVAVLDPIADGALSIIAQPDVPRNITVDIIDANSSASNVCTVTGKDMMGNVIEEVFTNAAGGTALDTGVKIFASLTTAVVTGEAGAAGGDSISIGIGDLIGLGKPIANESAVKYAALNNVPLTPDAIQTGDVSLAAVSLTGGTYDGSKPMRVLFQPGL